MADAKRELYVANIFVLKSETYGAIVAACEKCLHNLDYEDFEVMNMILTFIIYNH